MKKVLGVFLMIFSFPGMPLAHYDGTWPGMGWRHMMGFGYGGILVWSIFLIILGLLIFIIIKGIKSSGQPISSQETPLEILKKRYAKGDITKEEFESIKRDLEDGK